MALDRKQAPFEEQEPEEEEEEERELQLDGPAHHPPAPPDEVVPFAVFFPVSSCLLFPSRFFRCSIAA